LQFDAEAKDSGAVKIISISCDRNPAALADFGKLLQTLAPIPSRDHSRLSRRDGLRRELAKCDTDRSEWQAGVPDKEFC